MWGSSGEAVSEVVPETRVIDSVDLRAPDFARLARSGVTTVFVSPGSSAVIGARAAIVKTAGPTEGRIVRNADAIKASMGRDPRSPRGGYNRRPSARYVSTRTRRPTTRMGVAWVLRKALFDARDAKAGLGPIGGADCAPPRVHRLAERLARWGHPAAHPRPQPNGHPHRHPPDRRVWPAIHPGRCHRSVPLHRGSADARHSGRLRTDLRRARGLARLFPMTASSPAWA